VVLVKLGVPMIVAVLLAMIVSYVWWRYERNDNEERGFIEYLSALMDFRDIFKHFNKLFYSSAVISPPVRPFI